MHELRSPRGESVFLGYQGSMRVEHAVKPRKYAKCVRIYCHRPLVARWVMKAAADHLLSHGYEYVGDRALFSDATIDWKTLKRIECTCKTLPHERRCPAKKILEP